MVRAVRGASGMVTCFPPLRNDRQGPMPSVHVHRLDVGAECLADPQPVEGQQRDQRVVAFGTEPGLDEQRAEFIAVQAQGA